MARALEKNLIALFDVDCDKGYACLQSRQCTRLNFNWEHIRQKIRKIVPLLDKLVINALSCSTGDRFERHRGESGIWLEIRLAIGTRKKFRRVLGQVWQHNRRPMNTRVFRKAAT